MLLWSKHGGTDRFSRCLLVWSCLFLRSDRTYLLKQSNRKMRFSTKIPLFIIHGLLLGLYCYTIPHGTYTNTVYTSLADGDTESPPQTFDVNSAVVFAVLHGSFIILMGVSTRPCHARTHFLVHIINLYMLFANGSTMTLMFQIYILYIHTLLNIYVSTVYREKVGILIINTVIGGVIIVLVAFPLTAATCACSLLVISSSFITFLGLNTSSTFFHHLGSALVWFGVLCTHL
jgi:hypothetical protein